MLQINSSIEKLEANIENLMLEHQIEVLNSSLSSVISLFGAIGSIAALFLVGLVFWLNNTVNKKLKLIEAKSDSIELISLEISQNKDETLKYYNELKILENKISDILKLENKVNEIQHLSQIIFIYLKCYQKNTLNLKIGNDFIDECNQIISYFDNNKIEIEKIYGMKAIDFYDRLDYLRQVFNKEEINIKTWNLYNWDLDKFIKDNIDEISEDKIKDFYVDEEVYDFIELKWLVGQLNLLKQGKYEF